MRILMSVLLVVALAGCSETIKLRNDKTGKEISCGGEIKLPGRATRTDSCLSLYQGLGYKRVDQ